MLLRVGRRVVDPGWADEEGDQPPVARVEVEVVLFGHIQVGLLEDERHAQHALVEINDRLAVRADEGDMVDPLGLDFGHDLHSSL